ncbi:glycosyltransferase family 4 protein [Cochleicola gelatinilyticus]|nr:glycosyltransferase family 4 protein [Cochleicola gelatinilyticus]
MLSNKLFNNAAINVSPSLFLKEMFQKRGYNNVIFIPNSIELEKYPFLLRKAYPPKLLWVRSFSEIYNPMLALKVLKQLVENGIAASLCMIGPEKDGSLMKCKAFAEAENLPVIFTGKLTKEEWITRSKESTIFLNTTFYDNMPVSVIEAMALGLPVISTNVGGIPFLIQTKINGLLVPPDNTEAMISAITHLTTNPEDAMQIATNARKIVEDFDWINVKQKWMKVLNE